MVRVEWGGAGPVGGNRALRGVFPLLVSDFRIERASRTTTFHSVRALIVLLHHSFRVSGPRRRFPPPTTRHAGLRSEGSHGVSDHEI